MYLLHWIFIDKSNTVNEQDTSINVEGYTRVASVIYAKFLIEIIERMF
jgi:hypothetical protein